MNHQVGCGPFLSELFAPCARTDDQARVCSTGTRTASASEPNPRTLFDIFAFEILERPGTQHHPVKQLTYLIAVHPNLSQQYERN